MPARVVEGSGGAGVPVDPRCALELSARALKVERVGVWLLDAPAERIDCAHLYERSTHAFRSGGSLQVRDFPAYFALLRARRIIAADRAQTDPATAELTEAYLRKYGITSMVDAPLVRDGRVVGVVCHEHVGAPRIWLRKEIDFASTVAELLAEGLGELDSSGAQLDPTLPVAGRALALEVREIAHDINNVLTSLSLSSARLAGHADQSVGRVVADIAESVGAAQRLVSQLMRLHKARKTADAVTDVGEVVEKQLPTLTALLAGRGTLLVDARTRDCRVRMHAEELEQILLNLCANARDALLGSGSVRIVIRDSTAEDGGALDDLVLEVTDDGTGMDELTRARMFEPHFTTKARGTGMGLTLVRAVVARARGTVRVHTASGRGTRVCVTLPRLR